MVNYKQMYILLFNSITDAVKNMEQHNYGFAKFTLMEAQQKAEEIFVETDEESLS